MKKIFYVLLIALVTTSCNYYYIIEPEEVTTSCNYYYIIEPEEPKKEQHGLAALADSLDTKEEKILHNGQLIIVRDGHTYTVYGQNN